MRTTPRNVGVATGVAVVLLSLWIRLGPLPPGLLDVESDLSTRVVDRHGKLLYESRAADGMRGAWMAEQAMPPNLVSATVAAEDQRFFHHSGVDPIAIGRAAWRNLRARQVVEGGSSISQQVAKLLLGRLKSGKSPRGFRAKFREAVVALRLEHRLAKREILALYLNLAPYGNQIHGAERASRAYFGCPASMLTPAQAAFIAGLPQRPSRFNPFRNTASALARQKHVLDRMADLSLQPRAVVDQARKEQLVLKRDESTFAAPHFVEMILESYTDERPSRIDTTLDLDLQRDVQGIIESARPNLAQHRAHNVAVVVLDNARGEWLAWEGSGDYSDAAHGGTINGPLALRQPGSALKPFTYALAFEEGRSPATVLADVPSHFPTAEAGVVYTPRNYDGQYRGPLLARRALAGSENVPAVALAAEIGVPKLVRFLRRAGITSFDKTSAHYGVGLTLGNAEVRLAELTGAYAAFARGGMLLTPSAIRGGDRAQTRLVSPRSAFWITEILSDPDAREYVFGRGSSLDFPFPVAAKTGTSEGYHDNWAIGYTREVTVGVWVGNFDRSPLTNSSGVTGAGPIFHSVMLAAQKRVAGHLLEPDAPLAKAPDDVTRVAICALSGMRANPWCPARIDEWLPTDGPEIPCSWHHETESGTIVIWPPVYRQWAQQHTLHVETVARPADPRVRVSRPPAANRFAIANPPEGAIYLIDSTLRMAYQTLALRASADRQAGEIQWSVDGRPVGRADSDKALPWPLTPGEHHISARDERGRTVQTSIFVK